KRDDQTKGELSTRAVFDDLLHRFLNELVSAPRHYFSEIGVKLSFQSARCTEDEPKYCDEAKQKREKCEGEIESDGSGATEDVRLDDLFIYALEELPPGNIRNPSHVHIMKNCDSE